MGSLELGLEELEIIQRYESDEYYKFEVKCKEEPIICTQCMETTPLNGSWKFKYHDTRKRTIIDERLRRKKVVLEVHQRRFICPTCGKKFTEFIEAVSPYDKVTKRLWFTLGNEALQKNFSEVGDYFGLSDTTVKKAFDALIAQKDKERVLKAPRILGIDEVYVKLEKGKRKEGCAVFTDIENHKIIEFIRSVNKSDVIDVIQSMVGYENIEMVTMDMASAYRNAVKDTVPTAYCVVDHFHIIQKCNMAIDTVRKSIQYQLEKELDKAEERNASEETIAQIEKDKNDLYKARYYLRSGREMLEAEQAKRLTVQLDKYPKLKQCYWIKEALRDVYDCKTKYDAFQKYYEWETNVKAIHKQIPIPEMIGIMKMINRLRKEVFAFFDGRYTNAYAESFNNLVKEIIRIGKGYRFESLRGKVLYGTEATEPKKLRDMKFYAIKKVTMEDLDGITSDTSEDIYSENEWLIEGDGVDFLKLLEIIQEGNFRV